MTTYVATLTNPAAESGSTTGWTVEAGSFGVRSASPNPYAGSYYFYAGNTTPSVMRQRVDLVALGWTTTDLDAETVFATLSVRVAGYDGSQDPTQIGLRFLNGSLATIVEDYAEPWTTSQTWDLREYVRHVPVGARYVDILLKGVRSLGSNNDAYFDEVSLSTTDTVTAPALTNPGGEANSAFVCGWVSEGGSWGLRTADPAPYAGSRYFSPNSSANSITRQRLDLRALGASVANLDAGNVTVTLAAQMANYDELDNGQLGLRFLDVDLTELAVSYSPTYNTAKTWVARNYTATAPTGSRYVDLLLKGNNTIGAGNTDAYFDAVTVSVSASGGATASPSGIASTEAFGTAQLNLDLAPSGIASAESHGAPRLDLTITAQAIASAEAFGFAQLDQRIDATGIASGEAFWAATVSIVGGAQTVSPSAIASSEAFGAVQLDLTVSAASIASTEAFGVARADQTVSPSAIASGEAHGAATMGLEIVPTAITSAEAFSAATVTNAGTLALSGIPSGEAFGTAMLGLHIEPAGIAPSEAVGTPAVGNIVAPASIASAEAFGAAQIDQHVSVTGIVSAETFGVASLSGSITLSPASIGSGETVGQPALVLVIGPPSIGSAEAHGAARLDLEIRPAGITTLEAFGAPRVLALDMFAPDGISSGEAFGLPTTTLYIAPTGITSLAEVGRPTLTGGELNRLSKLVATLTVRAALDGRHSVSATVARGQVTASTAATAGFRTREVVAGTPSTTPAVGARPRLME